MEILLSLKEIATKIENGNWENLKVTTTRPKTDNYIDHICAKMDEIVDTIISKHLLPYLKQILVVHNGTYRNVKLSNTMIREVIYLNI